MMTTYQVMCSAEHASDVMFQQWEDEAERQAAAYEEAESLIDASEPLEEIEVNCKAEHPALEESVKGCSPDDLMMIFHKAYERLLDKKAAELLRKEMLEALEWGATELKKGMHPSWVATSLKPVIQGVKGEASGAKKALFPLGLSEGNTLGTTQGRIVLQQKSGGAQ